MRKLFFFKIILLLCVNFPIFALANGDRIIGGQQNINDWVPASLPRETYQIGPGDVLHIQVKGKSQINYQPRPAVQPDENPNEIVVTPSGEIQLSLLGSIDVTGKTVGEIETIIQTRLSEYLRDIEVSVSVSGIRTVNVWISGEVQNPGPQILPSVSTVSLAALHAGISPTGSTRRVTLIRDGDRHIVDLYKMAVTGDISDDMALRQGDTIHVPAVTRFVKISGEVTRPGQYEMEENPGHFRIKDLLSLALGTQPSAALDRAFVERIGSGNKKQAINVNLADPESPDLQMALKSGDNLVIPSISAFQPMIRLIGEFKGEGVYQRVTEASPLGVENKSGIYFLKQGQTVYDVISATGGVTPQADLHRARIEREEDGAVVKIPVDLDRLLIAGDTSVDMELKNGDSLVLPALADRVHVFGEVKTPGSYTYTPNRRLIEYLGDSGGTLKISRLTDVSVVRGNVENPKVTKYNVQRAIRGASLEGNPILQPGDIVYVPSKFIADWRDGVQLLFTALSLHSLLN